LRSARRFRPVQVLMRKYAAKFHVKLEQVSVQCDHIHLLVRVTRRSLFQHFLRVVSGQIAQQFQAHGLSIHPLQSQATCSNQVHNSQESPTAGGTGHASKIPSGKASKAEARNWKGVSPTTSQNLEVTDTPKPHTPATATKLWKYRPFTRVVRGWKAYRIVRDYITLNEKEASGEIRYSKARLRGLSDGELVMLRGFG
jgi:hypothetical protein